METRGSKCTTGIKELYFVILKNHITIVEMKMIYLISQINGKIVLTRLPTI